MFPDRDQIPSPNQPTDDQQKPPTVSISEEELQEIKDSQKLGIDEDNSVDILHKP